MIWLKNVFIFQYEKIIIINIEAAYFIVKHLKNLN